MDLHVTNIASTVTKIELRAHFEHLVPVAGVKLLPDGDALVSFDSDEDATTALQQLDGSELAGKMLSMRKALPRRERANDIRKQGETSDGEVKDGP
jgi:RNA recognition motif-containing protein